MSAWTHPICAPCWNQQHPDLGLPALAAGGFLTRVREQYRVDETCCFCGEITSAGIYVRHYPYDLRCRGEHGD